MDIFGGEISKETFEKPGPLVLAPGVTGVSSFHDLAEAYEAKATLYKMLLETLEDDKDRG